MEPTDKNSARLNRRSAKRAFILDTAEKLFDEKGYHSVSMAEIARNAKISTGTTYLYFKDKDDLFAALAERGSEYLNHQFFEIMKRPGSSLDRFIEGAKAFEHFYAQYGFYFDVLIDQKRGHKKELEPGTLGNMIEHTLRTLENLFQIFKNMDPSAEETHVEKTCLVAWATMLGLCRLLDFGRGEYLPFSKTELLKFAAELIHQGFVKQPSTTH